MRAAGRVVEQRGLDCGAEGTRLAQVHLRARVDVVRLQRSRPQQRTLRREECAVRLRLQEQEFPILNL